MGGLACDSCALAAGGDRLDPLLLPLLGCCVLLGEKVLLQAKSMIHSQAMRCSKNACKKGHVSLYKAQAALYYSKRQRNGRTACGCMQRLGHAAHIMQRNMIMTV